METSTAIAVLCIAGGGMGAQWLAWRLRLPAIVLLFGLGLLLGPGLGLLRPSEEFGAGALRHLVSLAVAIIVFEGGLALDFRELREAGGGVLRLTVVALPISLVLGAAAAHWIGGLPPQIALLYGAILVVTGPTVILPLLRMARLKARIGSFLKWEAIVNDPVGAILTGLILEFLLSGPELAGEGALGRFALHVAGGALASAGLGAGAALAIGAAFRRDAVSELLKTPILIAAVLCLDVVSNLLLGEAGLIAATVFGVVLANRHVPGLHELRRFKEALVVLLVSSLFIVLTADLDRGVLAHLSWPVVALTAAMLVVVRPLAIWLATLRSDLTARERVLVGWVAPRGIVAAATAGVAGLRLQEAHVAGAELIQPMVFALIAATVVLHGLTLKPLARRLGLTAGNRPTLALVGAAPWSTDLAARLHQEGVPVLLVDSYPGALRTARRIGLPTLQAELLSRRAEEGLADQPIDYLLAATRDQIYNALVCTRLAPEVGRERVYQLAPTHEHMIHPERGMARDWRGKILDGDGLDYAALTERYEGGWRFRILDAGEARDEAAVLLVVLHQDGAIAFPSRDHAAELEPGDDDRLVVFAPAERALP